MNANQALDFTNRLLEDKGYKKLTNVESTIFREAWEGKTGKDYSNIATDLNYQEGTIKTTAYRLWKQLSKLLRVQKVSRSNLREQIEAAKRSRTNACSGYQESVPDVNISQPTLDFYGLENEIEKLTSNEKRSDYKQALELTKAAGLVETYQDIKLILNAFEIYKKHGDIEQAANLVLKPVDTYWETREHVGRIAYRLGVLTPMSSAINWLIEKIEAGHYLPAPVTALLYNQGGDLIWMSSNDTLLAIPFHQKAQELANKSQVSNQASNIIISSEFNKALCNIDCGKIEEARRNISKGYNLIASDKIYNHRRHEISFDCLFAYVETLNNKQEAAKLADKAYSTLLNDQEFEKLKIWEKNNLPIYVARSLQNIGNYGGAFEMYMKAASLAKASGCIQVEAQTLIGQALLYYLEDKRFTIEKAISCLLQARKIFELIKAEGDEAEVNLILGVMFKELGKTQESKESFDKVEKFYKARNAPEKMMRLNRIRGGDSLI